MTHNQTAPSTEVPKEKGRSHQRLRPIQPSIAARIEIHARWSVKSGKCAVECGCTRGSNRRARRERLEPQI